MRDPRLAKLADVLVNYSARVRPGDLCGITADPAAEPLTQEVMRAVIKAGGHPFVTPRRAYYKEAMLEHASTEQLEFSHPMQMHYINTVNVHISLWAEENTRTLSRYDTARQARLSQGYKPFLDVFMARSALTQGDPRRLRWIGTQMPTQASAQDAEMSLAQYEDFVFRAGLLHLDDPASAWHQIFQKQELVRRFLQGKKVLRFRAPACDGHDGTDLRVDVSKAIWQNCAGESNFPDGEVFAGPTLPGAGQDQGGFGVEGHVNYSFPAVYNGHEVLDVRLEFKQGRVTKVRAAKGEQYLISMLDQDAGARNLGEIAIGTNYGITDFSRNTLFDEKIGGTFHAAVGAGYPESGCSNTSALHWDMVCDLRPRIARDGSKIPGGTIEADGEIFHRDGLFLLPGW
jgi:aminopeptidase